jgi:hypothetical protein
MPGLVPGIHVLFLLVASAWMAGTSPAMTARNYFPTHFGGRFSENAFGPSI